MGASASVLPMNFQLISFRMDWFGLLEVQGTLKSLAPQIPELLIKGMISVSPDSCHLPIHRKVLNS